MKPQEYCLKCGSHYLIKIGKQNNETKISWRQKYQCKNCKIKFTGYKKHLTEQTQEDFKYKERTPQPRNWSAINQAHTTEKNMSLDILLELLDLIQIKDTKRTGRPRKNPKDMIYAMLLKTYNRTSSRRIISDLQNAQRTGHISSVPSYSTIMNYYNDKNLKSVLTALIELSATPLASNDEIHIAVDASGFSTSKFGRWFDCKHGEETERRIYRKAHIAVGVKSNIVTSVILTDQHANDCPHLKSLIAKTSLTFEIKEVSADKAYISKENIKFIGKMNAVPYIPFKSNTRGGKRGLLWRKMYLMFKNNPQEFYERYHLRSNVECCFSQIKARFGDTLLTKNIDSNFNEILCKVLAHNLVTLVRAYHEFDIKASFETKTPVNEQLVIYA